ncbi:MAG: farnesyl-diphosphate synthase [Clostridiales bacterium]|nr:MAG: farnesyl-diphosphate synthase [Clostridiales bacterium]
MEVREKLIQLKDLVEHRLSELLPAEVPELLRDSMMYSLLAGGKRLRPAMHLLAAELVDGRVGQCLDMACAIEMIHTYSLIHDDLPALDNDVLRRGRATNHVVYGEAQAILAGDGLLNCAYETMLRNALRYPSQADKFLKAIEIIAKAAGVTGMIAGQVMDVALEGQQVDFSQLQYIHAHKTGDMITGALLSGAALFTENAELLASVESYGRNVGLVFQIVDDILDITAGEELGKSRGKDAEEGKVTYPSLFGIEKSRQIAKEKTEAAKAALAPFGNKADMLCQLADMMLERSM